MLVTSADELRQLVRIYEAHDAFVFDLETRYIPTDEEVARNTELRARSPKDRSAMEKAWLEEFDMRATDELLNETIWFGLATAGRSDSIACGHPNGELVRPAGMISVPVSDVYPLGHPKRTTKLGKESKAHVKRAMPAVFTPPPPQLDVLEACEILEPLMFSERRKINQNLRFDVRSLAKYYSGELLPPSWGELQVALQILNENAFNSWDLENFVSKRLGHRYNKLGKKGVTNFSFIEAARYAEQDARFTWLLWAWAERKLKEDPVLWELFEFEMEVAYTLRPQEVHGIKVDREELTRLHKKYETERKEIIERLIVDYGAPIGYNPASHRQTEALLYDKLGAQFERRTMKTNVRSVSAEVLEGIVIERSEAAGAAALLLEYADKTKTIGTYFVGIGSKLTERDYIHSSFAQHGTRTGRLTCYAPNLHQIPRDSDVRGMFIPDKGQVLIDVDYDQIELRFICMFAEEEKMRDLFLGDHDIHTATAALVTGKDPSEIDGETRNVAGKNPNFLISYGGSAFRLHMMTGEPLERCKEIIDTYFKQFPRLMAWKQTELARARRRTKRTMVDGAQKVTLPYVETMMGRRRRLSDLLIDPRAAGSNQILWKFLNKKLIEAERQAINAIIQGSAAETLKLAMIDLHRQKDDLGFPIDVVLNVHDEIVAVCPEKYAEEGLKMVVTTMENVVNPRTGEGPLAGWVPLIASGKICERWSKG